MGTLASLNVEIGANTAPLTAGLGKAEAEIKGFTSRSSGATHAMASDIEGSGTKAGDALSGIGKAAMLGGAVVGVAVLGAGVMAVKMAADFQSAIVALKTGAGESQANLAMVSDGILKMAVETGTSTKALTDGMYMVESAGFHGAAALDVLRAAAEGAKVGNADLGTVANAVTSGLNAYGLAGTDAAMVTNTLIATVAAGKMHMEDLAGSLGTIVPIAATAGVSLQQVGAAMATMTSMGVDAHQAATFLRQTIVSLSVESPKGAKALKSLGLSAEEIALGLRKTPSGFIDTMREISTALDKKFPGSAAIANAEFAKVKAGSETMDAALANLATNTSPGYIKAIKDIAGGSKTMQGMLLLTGQHVQVLQGNFDSITKSVKEGGKSITGWSDVQATFNFKLDQAKAVVEGLMISIGTHLLPVLSSLMDTFEHFVGDLQSGMSVQDALSNNFGILGTAIGAVVTLVQDFVKVIGFMIDHSNIFLPILGALIAGFILYKTIMTGIAIYEAVASAMTILAGAYALVTTGEASAATAADALAISELAALWPILLIVASLLILGATIYMIIKHFDQIKDALGRLIGWLGSNWKMVVLVLLTFPFSMFYLFLTKLGPTIWGFMKDAFSKVIEIVKQFGSDLKTKFGDLIGAALQEFAHLGSGLKTKFGDLVGAVGQEFEHLASGVKTKLGDMIGAIGQILGGLAGQMYGWMKTAMGQLLKALQDNWVTIIAFIALWPLFIILKLVGLGIKLGTWAAGALADLLTALGTEIVKIYNWFTAQPAALLALLAGFSALLVTWITTAFTNLLTAIGSAFVAIGAWFTALPGNIMTMLIGFDIKLAGWITAAFQALLTAAATIAATVVTFFANLPGRIIAGLDFYGTLLSRLGTWIWYAVANLVNAAADGAWGVLNWFTNLPSVILSKLTGFGTLLYDIGKALIQGLMNGIGSMLTGLKNKLGDIGGLITSWKGPPAKDAILLRNNGRLIMAGLMDGIMSQENALQNVLGGIGDRIAIKANLTSTGAAIGATAQMPALSGAGAGSVVINQGDTHVHGLTAADVVPAIQAANARNNAEIIRNARAMQ